MEHSPFYRRVPSELGFFALGSKSPSAEILGETGEEPGQPEVRATAYKKEMGPGRLGDYLIRSLNRLSQWDPQLWPHEEHGLVAFDERGLAVGYADAKYFRLRGAFSGSGEFLDMASCMDGEFYSMAQVLVDQELYPWETLGGLVVLHRCEVRESARGRSLGRALAQEVVARTARGRKDSYVLMKPFPLDWGLDEDDAEADLVVSLPAEILAAREKLLSHWEGCFPYVRRITMGANDGVYFLIGPIPGDRSPNTAQ